MYHCSGWEVYLSTKENKTYIMIIETKFTYTALHCRNHIVSTKSNTSALKIICKFCKLFKLIINLKFGCCQINKQFVQFREQYNKQVIRLHQNIHLTAKLHSARDLICFLPSSDIKFHSINKRLSFCFLKSFREQIKKTNLFDFWARKEQKVTVAEETLIPWTTMTCLTLACW